MFPTGLQGSVELADAGAILALRALGWGTLYAVAGTSCLCYGIWKLSGAKDVSFKYTGSLAKLVLKSFKYYCFFVA